MWQIFNSRLLVIFPPMSEKCVSIEKQNTKPEYHICLKMEITGFALKTWPLSYRTGVYMDLSTMTRTDF